MATIRMKLILLPLLCFIANAQKQCPLSCYVDYIQTMDCTWKERNNNSHITLQVFRVVSNRFSHENNCTFTRHSMLPMEDERWIHYYTCIMHFQMFMNIDKFKITLKSNSPANTSQTCIIEEFIPSQNIHLKAPQQLSVTVNSTTRKVIITWQNHASQYLKNCLEHEVEFWSRETKEDVKVKNIVNDIQHLAIEESELKPVTDYKARVRSIPSRRTDYNGRWSKWSSEIKWKTNSDSQVVKNIEVEPNPYTFLMEETYYSEPKKAQFQTFPMVTSATDSPSKQSSLLIVVLLPISLAIIISILLYFRIHIRIVNKVWIHIPNPGNFFQPLYSEHNGNFKEWVRNDQSTIQKRSRRSSVHEITKMKRSLEDEADTVIITPRIEAVSNITYIKPIPIHYTSALDPNSLKHNNDADSMYVKKNCLIDPRNRFYSNSVLEYSNSICGLSGNQSIVPTEGQQVESWLLFEDLANATLLSMMPQDPNGEYNYSDDYCTLSHSDTSHGLVPTKIGLQLNCDGCQAEKRDVPMSLEAIDSDKLPSICTTSTQQ
ncbi:interleukin-21 receptor-like isoform X2 [Chiloscyllium plagiosum]|nr:interleukin-21 receptor-like isoform X2 [Chiloscyllium plagiosum]